MALRRITEHTTQLKMLQGWPKKPVLNCLASSLAGVRCLRKAPAGFCLVGAFSFCSYVFYSTPNSRLIRIRLHRLYCREVCWHFSMERDGLNIVDLLPRRPNHCLSR